jgi:hypothetical protein
MSYHRKAYDLKTRRTFAWKLGRRNADILREFLSEIGIDGRDNVGQLAVCVHH